MTLQQLDDALKAWKSRLSAVAENLLELQTDVTFQSLSGTGGLQQISLQGVTAAKCGPALRQVNELFRQFGQLQATVDRAQSLRNDLPTFFGADARLLEAQKALFARSIEIEAEELPLAARELDREARPRLRLTPEDLLARMTESFASVRDLVATVGESWAKGAQGLESLDAEVERVRSQTALPSHLLSAEIQALEALLEKARGQMQTDPLGALGFLAAQAEPAVARLGERIRRAAEMRAEVRSADSTWRSVEVLHNEALLILNEAQSRYLQTGPIKAPVEEATLEALGAWLGRLEARVDEGAIDAVAVGLRNWRAAADRCQEQDRAVLHRCRDLISAGNELRGRMGALAAKARTRGLAEDEEAEELRGAAEALLREVPADLQRAAGAVARFERRLRQTSGARETAQGVSGV